MADTFDDKARAVVRLLGQFTLQTHAAVLSVGSENMTVLEDRAIATTKLLEDALADLVRTGMVQAKALLKEK